MADVIGIGSAYVDYFFKTDKKFLNSLKLKPEDDFLFSEKKIKREDILKNLSPITKSPGGITPNTLSALSFLKVKCAYFGVIGKDQEGKYWKNKIGPIVKTKILFAGKMPMCACLLTHNGQERTFLSEQNNRETDFLNEIDIDFINRAKIIHIAPLIADARKGIKKTLKLLESIKGPLISFNPSMFYIKRARKEIMPIIKKSDIVFFNEAEIKKFTDYSPKRASKYLLTLGPKIIVCTLSKKGSLITSNSGQFLTERHNVAEIVDTTGAGDTFAAGFLYGVLKKKSLKWSSSFANRLAAKSLNNFGQSWQKNKK